MRELTELTGTSISAADSAGAGGAIANKDFPGSRRENCWDQSSNNDEFYNYNYNSNNHRNHLSPPPAPAAYRW
jgi:hypothetical protein